jgi:hypothetical protein
MPAQFQIQIHPARVPQLEVSIVLEECALLAATESLITSYTAEEGEDDGCYVNIDLQTTDRSRLWDLVKTKLYGNAKFGAALAASSMTICTGDDGWDDYMLLHHYDRTLRLDSFEDR